MLTYLNEIPQGRGTEFEISDLKFDISEEREVRASAAPRTLLNMRACAI